MNQDERDRFATQLQKDVHDPVWTSQPIWLSDLYEIANSLGAKGNQLRLVPGGGGMMIGLEWREKPEEE